MSDIPSSYSATGSALRPYRLTQKDLLAIGRLIRACAEIEEIIDLYLYKLADIAEGAGIILLGRMPASARLQLIQTFSLSKGKPELKLYKQAFDNDSYRQIVRCRNTVAHGWLLGITDSDQIAFQVQETTGVDGNEIISRVNAYSRDAFDLLAKSAEKIIPQMEANFGLKPLRERRHELALCPHPKSRSQGKRTAKPERQPPPSKG